MPLAPDVEHFLTSSEQLCHLGIDTGYFFRFVSADPNAYVGAYDARNRSFPKRKHLDTLRDMARYCEEGYLAWRAGNREHAVGASHMNFETMSEQIACFVGDLSTQLVNRGHRHLDRKGLGQSQLDYGTCDCLHVLKRAATRSWHDLHGYEPSRVEAAREMNDRLFQAHRQDDMVALMEMRRAMGVDESLIGTAERESRKARAEVRRQVDRDRRVAKRSVRMAERFLGTGNVRMFIGGDVIRIRGANAVYRIARSGALLQSHGSATLSVYDGDGETFLCRLCIYTDKVPMLDHVISLILHIKAGSEEDILSTGNAYEVADAAYDRPWLARHLPVSVRDDETALPFLGSNPHVWDGPDRAERLVSVRREVARFVFDHIGPVRPPMPQTEAYLLSGLPERTFYSDIASEAFMGEIPERAILPMLVDGHRAPARTQATIDI